jgi:hypothetical protein
MVPAFSTLAAGSNWPTASAWMWTAIPKLGRNFATGTWMVPQ